MASESPVGGRVPLVASWRPATGGSTARGRRPRRGRRLRRRRPRRVRLAPGARRPARPRRARARARAAGGDRDPDVLLVGHDKAPARKLLERVAAEPGPLEAHPRVADTARRGGDKVVRRALLDRGRGPPGLLATWRALLAAEPIDALPATACMERGPGRRGRRRPTSSPPTRPCSPPRTCRPRAASWSRPPPSATCSRCSSRRRAGPRTTRSSTASPPSSTRHGSGGERGRVARVRASLLARDRPRAYRAVGRADRTPSAPPAAARAGCAPRAAKRLRSERRRRAYKRRAASARWTSTSPSTPRTGTPAYSCNPRAIYEKARELAPEIRGVWVVKPEHAAKVPAGVEVVAPGTPEYLDVMARAKYFVNNVNFPNEYVKRPGSVHVMTHHGTPLKYMGMDLRSNPVTAAKMDFDALLRRCARWDFSVSSNPLSSEVWAKVYPVAYENLEVGYPRNDVLATATGGGRRRRPRVARPRAGAARRPLRADAPRLGDGPRARARPRRGGGGARPGRDPARPRALLLRCGPGRPRAGPRRAAARRRRASVDRDPVPGGGRAGDRLFLADVRLRRPGPPDRDPRARLGALQGHARRLLRPDGGAARRRLRAARTSCSTCCAPARSRPPEADAQRAAFRARFCALEDGRAAERVVRRVMLGDHEAAAPPAASLA